jgi:hypothetical protein
MCVIVVIVKNMQSKRGGGGQRMQNSASHLDHTKLYCKIHALP